MKDERPPANGKPTSETHFVVKCHACGQAYAVPRAGGLAQEKFLARGPRCINTEGLVDTSGRGAYYGNVTPGQMCGALLGRGLLSRNELKFVEPQALLGWVVVQNRSIVDPKKLEQRIADLERELNEINSTDLVQEVQRLRTKYETPCPLMVRHYDDDEHYHLVPCGGFLGHPSGCAEVF